jgi:hypothetical protein
MDWINQGKGWFFFSTVNINKLCFFIEALNHITGLQYFEIYENTIFYFVISTLLLKNKKSEF